MSNVISPNASRFSSPITFAQAHVRNPLLFISKVSGVACSRTVFFALALVVLVMSSHSAYANNVSAKADSAKAVSTSQAQLLHSPRYVVETTANKMTTRLIADKVKVAEQAYYIEHLVEEVLLPVVDHTYMTRSVLAKHWRKATNEQKLQFIDALKHKVIRTYAGAFKAFNGETIVFQDAKFNRAGNKASVRSTIERTGASAINVTYMLYRQNDGWLTYDVVIEGVSLVTSFRDQFGLSIEKHGLAQAISLLASEYKNQNPVLKLGGDIWEPYISNHLPANGLAVKLVSEVLIRAGYQVEVEIMPWLKVSTGLASGDVDISIASWFNETRAKEMQFTQPYLDNELVIVKRKSDDFSFDSAQSFKTNLKNREYKLGIFKDYGYGEFFNEIAPYTSINYFKFCTSMLRDIATGKIDIALIDRWTAEKNLLLQQNVAEHLAIIPTTVITKPLHTAISGKRKDRKDIAANFNKTLKEMRADGSYDKILMQYNYQKSSN